MTLEELRAEYERETIGPAIYAEIVRLVRMVTGRYDPRVYGGVPDWSSGIEDLVQEVIVERLLGEAQLDYAMTVAVDVLHWRRLVERQVRRSLAHRRQRSVVDNLLERTDAILGRPPFSVTGIAGVPWYGLAGRATEERRPTDQELAAAFLVVASVPVAVSHGSDRAPSLYSTRALEAILEGVAAALPCRFAKNDLDRIFRSLLTQWLASDLVDIEGVLELPSESLTPEDMAEAKEIVEYVVEGLSDEDALILGRKIGGWSDGEIAQRLGLSRPTVALRKQRILSAIGAALEDATERVREAAVADIMALVAEKVRADS